VHIDKWIAGMSEFMFRHHQRRGGRVFFKIHVRSGLCAGSLQCYDGTGDDQ